jgi:phage/plasmid-like protein (TIGR03299 family)
VENQKKNQNRRSQMRQVAWANCGEQVHTDSRKISEILRDAHLDWGVAQTPMSYFCGETLMHDDARVVNYRTDTLAALGVVSPTYNVVQTADAFAFAECLIQDHVSVEKAGVVQNGRKVWLLCKMEKQHILNDEYVPYLLLVNGFDGQTPVHVCMTPLRVKCSNTINPALRTSPRKWTFLHTSKIAARLANAKESLAMANNYMSSLASLVESLATQKLTRPEFNGILDTLFPVTGGVIAQARREAKLNLIHNCYEQPDVSEYKGTAYGALLAISDYTSHSVYVNNADHKQSRWDQHFVNTVYEPASIMMSALSILSHGL